MTEFLSMLASNYQPGSNSTSWERVAAAPNKIYDLKHYQNNINEKLTTPIKLSNSYNKLKEEFKSPRIIQMLSEISTQRQMEIKSSPSVVYSPTPKVKVKPNPQQK